MGSGGGGTLYATTITGMTGGRIIPGASSTATSVSGLFAFAGGGAGVAGGSYTGILPVDFSSVCGGAGGGGWGASGGSVPSDGVTNTSSINLGAAGGKAINTNGNAVTFIGGSNRVFGVIG